MTVEPIPYAAPLTPRQASILALIVDGLTNGQIADAVGMSYDGVKDVASALYNLTGTNSRHELVAYAFRSGIVKVEGRS